VADNVKNEIIEWNVCEIWENNGVMRRANGGES